MPYCADRRYVKAAQPSGAYHGWLLEELSQVEKLFESVFDPLISPTAIQSSTPAVRSKRPSTKSGISPEGPVRFGIIDASTAVPICSYPRKQAARELETNVSMRASEVRQVSRIGAQSRSGSSKSDGRILNTAGMQ